MMMFSFSVHSTNFFPKLFFHILHPSLNRIVSSTFTRMHQKWKQTRSSRTHIPTSCFFKIYSVQFLVVGKGSFKNVFLFMHKICVKGNQSMPLMLSFLTTKFCVTRIPTFTKISHHHPQWLCIIPTNGAQLSLNSLTMAPSKIPFLIKWQHLVWNIVRPTLYHNITSSYRHFLVCWCQCWFDSFKRRWNVQCSVLVSSPITVIIIVNSIEIILINVYCDAMRCGRIKLNKSYK